MQAHGRGPQGEFEAQYHYDALGRRSRKTVRYKGKTEQTTRFLWQGYRLLQEQRDDGSRRSWSYDPASPWSPLAALEQAGDSRSADIYWYHTDLNSAPLEVTDAAGNLCWSGQYDTFGKLQGQTVAGAAKRQGAQYQQPLRYAGQYQDDESGLRYNLFRYYEPEVGRFTTQDPIGLRGGLNLYQYAPNPLMWVDPFGLTCSHSAKNPKQAHAAIKDKWGHDMTPKEMKELHKTVDNIKLNRPAYARDGIEFENSYRISPNSQRLDTGSGPYREWTVKTPGVGNRGTRRIVVDKATGKAYYSHDHYDSFIEIDLSGWK
ncbi:TPA: RHS domain-containing protein [Serratia marcescens]|nr:RHS domain-containing protein [Serratia marcescens]HEJ8114699.1 RHS domain-containing protein [Serratia marcescens]HEJ9065186.1 RHS domain-containing protein [Serratia marcescens]HEJ9105541.1 RHS domain-containing protein [Serratia marcescens]